MVPLPSSSNAPAGASCWICLEDGPDDNGKPLVRGGCSCRGDSAGWGHVSCVAGYAHHKSETAYATVDAECNPDEFIRDVQSAWSKCRTCEQMFTGEMLMSMANAWCDLTEPLPDSDVGRIISTLNLATVADGEDNGEPNRNLKVGFATVIVLRRLKKALAILQSGVVQPAAPVDIAVYLELEILERLCVVSLKMNNKEKALQCAKLFYGGNLKHKFPQENIDSAKELVRYLSSESVGDENTIADTMKSLDEVIKSNGKDHSETIEQARIYAAALIQKGKICEGTEILQEYGPRARRLFGPDHPETRMLEDLLHPKPPFRGKITGFNNDFNGLSVLVLRPAKGHEGKYIVRFVCAFDAKILKFKVPGSNIIFAGGTPVVIQDLISEHHLNGKAARIGSFLEDTIQYNVTLDDNHSTCAVQKENVRVSFD